MSGTLGRRLFLEAASWMSAHYPAVAGGLLTADPADGELVRVAEEVLERYAAKTGAVPAAFPRGLEAVATLSFDFLRLQSRFMSTTVQPLAIASSRAWSRRPIEDWQS